MQTKGEKLQGIYEFNASYLAYQYLLIFSYGEDGYIPVHPRNYFEQSMCKIGRSLWWSRDGSGGSW